MTESKDERRRQKGGRKKLAQEALRSKKILVNFSQPEYDLIKKYLEESGTQNRLSVDVRKRYLSFAAEELKILGHPREQRKRKDLELLRREVYKAGVNINQIAHRVNTYKDMMNSGKFLNEIQQDLSQSKQILLQILKVTEQWSSK